MQRRTFIQTGLATAGIALVGLPTFAQVPMPPIFEHESLGRCRANGKPIADVLRGEFIKRIAFIPSVRTDATQRRMLAARYTFEMAYDGLPPGWNQEQFEREIASIMMMEIAYELASMQPLNLVAFDTPGPMLDVMTFEPYLGFYLD